MKKLRKKHRILKEQYALLQRINDVLRSTNERLSTREKALQTYLKESNKMVLERDAELEKFSLALDHTKIYLKNCLAVFPNSGTHNKLAKKITNFLKECI